MKRTTGPGIFTKAVLVSSLCTAAVLVPAAAASGQTSLPCPGGTPQSVASGPGMLAHAGTEAPAPALFGAYQLAAQATPLAAVGEPVFETANQVLPVEVQETTLLTLINTERTLAGLAPLQVNVWARDIARSWSQKMAAVHAISHNTEYMAQGRAAMGADALGENVACDYSIPTMHLGLMNSPSHRVNILDPKWTHIGVGIAVDNTGYLYGTQEFARIPAAAAPVPAPSPSSRQTTASGSTTVSSVTRAAPAAVVGSAVKAAVQPQAAPARPVATIVLPEVPEVKPEPAARPDGPPRRPPSRGIIGSPLFNIIAGVIFLALVAALLLARRWRLNPQPATAVAIS